MPNFKLKSSEIIPSKNKSVRLNRITKSGYERFNPAILGLGDISTPAVSIDTIAAVFDLEGFTTFCTQVEPQLSVPKFLNTFLNWLMDQIKSQTKNKEIDDGIDLYSPLPYYVKFLGDGLLVLWDSSLTSQVNRRNIIIQTRTICNNYKKELYPKLKKILVQPPQILRCGLARGTAFSVGNGNDYVGTCINMAARLQKLPGLSFSVNIRGFDLDDDSTPKHFSETYNTVKFPIRGIGDNELILVIKKEFDILSDAQKSFFESVD